MQSTESIISSSFEILRRRSFISHDQNQQQIIKDEFTIKSKVENLTNILLTSDDFLPNLIVYDEQKNQLPIISTNYVKKLLKEYQVKKGHEQYKDLLENQIKSINEGKSHLFWIKIPSTQSLKINQVKKIILVYTPKIQNKTPELLLIVKKTNYPFYLSLIKQRDYNLKPTKYFGYFNGQFQEKSKLDFVTQYDNSISTYIRIQPENKEQFVVQYSIKIKPILTLLTVGSVTVLSILAFIPILAVFQILPYYSENHVFYQKNLEIGMFVIGASFIIPTFTKRLDIQSTFLMLYIIPIVLGGLLFFAR